MPADDLVIVTLNTWKCDGAYRDRLALIGDGLRALRPDILLLQEAFECVEANADTAAYLSDALGLDRATQPARDKVRRFEGRPRASRSGLAVLSRWRIAANHRIELPGDPADGERVAQLVRIAAPTGTLAVVNVHLTHLDGADDLRRRQLAAILDRLDAEDASLPVLLGGDFNAPPDSGAIDWLMNRCGRPVVGGWWKAGMFPSTLNPVEGGDHDRGACLDHLFLLGDGWARFRLSGCARVLDRPDPVTGLYPSDHAGVRMTVALDIA